jgi:ribonuclease HIII
MGKPYVTKITAEQGMQILKDLESKGFEISPRPPAYAVFSARSKGISCTFYESGKFLVQGKEMDEFIEFYLEPEVLQTFSYGQKADLDYVGRIGIDESGKGDFFGPLCIAGAYAEGDQIDRLADLGVCDSKALKDDKAISLAAKIRKTCAWHVVRINPERYNVLYTQFKNLNRLLAWGHATVIENLVQKTNCRRVLIDQFANESVVESALKQKNLQVDLTQRHRAEEDLVVAAASILARDAFLQGLNSLSEQWKVKLPKGASKQVIAQGKSFVLQHSFEDLRFVCKEHFKTLDALRL